MAATANRILSDSIITSRRISSLSWFEYAMFVNLIVSADDYGVYYADPSLLAGTLFPRHTGVNTRMVREGLKHLEDQGLIFRYTAEGEEYLKLVSWEKHQRLRNSRRKYPAPEEKDGDVPAEEDSLPAEAAEPEAETEARELPVAELPLNDGSVYGVTRQEAEAYAELYPAVDIAQELRNIRGWCLANPTRRKTRNGVKKFINAWLSREQNRGGPGKHASPDYNPFLELAMEPDENRKEPIIP